MKNWNKKIGLSSLILIMAITFFGFQKEAFAATVGSSQLKQAESGWSRIVDTNPLITYTGTWTKYNNTLYSTGSASASLTDGATASFWFKGDKLRVIGSRNLNKSKVMKIQIDETTYVFSAYGNAQTDTLLFEKTGLENKDHQVTLIYQKEDSTDFVLSAIDISNSGALIPAPTPEPTPEPTPDPEPEQPSVGRAILVVTMDTGFEKEFDLSMEEVKSFITWYENKQAGSGTASYAIDKHDNNKGPFKSRKNYVIFNKILNFEVSEYSTTQ